MTDSKLNARLDAVRTLGKFNDEAVQQFGRFIQTSPEEALFRTNPLKYAAESGLDETRAIDLFLHAVHAGVLDMSWGMRCPGCASFVTAPAGLRSITVDRRCDLCETDNTLDLDSQVEVAFSASPSARHLRFHSPEELDFRRDGLTLFFSRSVQYQPEAKAALESSVIASPTVGAGQTVEVEATFEAGRYLVIAPLRHSVLYLKVGPSGVTHELTLELLESGFLGGNGVLLPGKGKIKLVNRTDESVPLGVLRALLPPPEERNGKTPPPFYTKLPFLSGKRLLSTQTFRDLFRAESVPGANGLALKNLTLLFTDLKGSTEMYERIGDLRAYNLVREHFELLRGVVNRRGGAVVKTMGDAIMASFADAPPALEAAAEMNREIGTVGVNKDLLLKIGLHAGPCIAVESNDRLDYFGQTVNIAARVQNISGASEIVVTDPVFNTPGVSEVLKANRLTARRELAVLKGVDGEVVVHRLA